jgi:hypothetical protein
MSLDRRDHPYRSYEGNDSRYPLDKPGSSHLLSSTNWIIGSTNWRIAKIGKHDQFCRSSGTTLD